jgi:hypothetical protein
MLFFAPFVSDESGLANHLTALEGPDHEVALWHSAYALCHALGWPLWRLLQGAAKGIGLAR